MPDHGVNKKCGFELLPREVSSFRFQPELLSPPLPRQAAQCLLERGLPAKDCVVFLDEEDRRMVLVRDGMRVMPMSQCFIPLERRFTLYDQVRPMATAIA